MATFMEMPDVASNRVFNQLNVKDILKLGKTCRGIRSFLSIEKPYFRIKSLNVQMHTDEASFSIETTNKERFVSTYKMIDANKTSVSEKQNRIVDSNYMKLIINDLEVLFNNQKPSHEPFDIYICFSGSYPSEEIINQLIETFLTSLKEILASRNPLIRINCLNMEVMDHKQVMLVLPLISSETLHQINLESATGDHRPLEMSEIISTQHWRHIQSFGTERFITTASVRDFAHISDLDTEIRTVTVADLVFLKQALTTSTTSSYHHFVYETFDDADHLIEVFGPPEKSQYEATMSDGETTTWLFDTPTEREKLVFILCEESELIEIERMDVERLNIEPVSVEQIDVERVHTS